MTTKSQEIYKRADEAGLVEKRSFITFKKDRKEHIIKFISDMAIDGVNFRTGKEEKKMKYTFEEDGVEKFYEPAIFTLIKGEDGKVIQNEDGSSKKKLSIFVEQMNNFEYGDTLKARYTPIPGTPKGFIKIEKMNLGEGEEEEIEEGNEPHQEKTAQEVKKEEIPVVEDDPFGTEEKEVNVDNIPF